jgi:hypothetical protein
MPARPARPPIEVRRFTPEKAARVIDLLNSRIADIKALETVRYDDPTVGVALDKIRGNTLEIFGENSREYREHHYYSISGGDSIVSMGFDEDPSYHEAQCQQDFLRGIPRTIAMLGGLIDIVSERTDAARPAIGELAKETREPSYDVAEVCTNGHVTNAAMKARPHCHQAHCEQCGASTITRCQRCLVDIRGEFHGDVVSVDAFPAPPFCVHCGDPFPWTQGKLDAARELAMELEGLTPDEQGQLARSLDDLVRDTPRTALAATRFKRLVGKAGAGAAGGFKDILVSVVVEAAKKIIWP